MIELNVYSQDGKIVGKDSLPEKLFGVKPNDVVLYEAVRMYMANKRRGTASTKTRAEARGGGRKPWRQKHTGRARHGSIRSPIWVGGGIVFGPKPRYYSYTIPRKKRRLALMSALSYKVREGKILLLDKLEITVPKTRTFHEILLSLGWSKGKKFLFLLDKIDDTIYKAGRNILGVGFKYVGSLNALDVLSQDTLLFTLEGLKKFKERFSVNGSEEK
jgi:large subunit ribosomal protein L4